MTHHKTRHLSLLEFLECLIREYMVADLRRKIYPKRSDKLYWGKVCEWKEDKIKDITERNNMPNIFDDKDTQKKYRDLYYPKNKAPLLLLCKKDLVHYYYTDTDVIVENGKGIRYGTILHTDFDTYVADVSMKDTHTQETCSLNIVRRII